jgi:F420-0:gamma-glutamyl ligase-like protein
VRLRVKAIETRYWRPGDDYLKELSDKIQPLLRDGDAVVISEKAISTSSGNIVDESKVKPGVSAKLIAMLWMRLVWGRFLGKICHFKDASIRHLRNYPLREGAAHKQIVLQLSGLLNALKYGSEAGIDVSNMPHSLACLPLEKPGAEARRIYRELKKRTGKKITVIISDTDSTFSFHSLHFTSHPKPLRGIISLGGFFPFVLGRTLRLRQRATPLALEGLKLSLEEALDFAEIAHHLRGYGAGRTVWDTANRYGVDFSEVTWEMLSEASHFPIVLIRKK